MSQNIVWGIDELPRVLRETASRRVLLVVDASFPFLSIKREIESMAVPYVVFDGFTPNPLYEDVCKGVERFRAEECDTIVAVGGGSSIDVAKCIKLYSRMDSEICYLEQEYADSGVPMVAIPTTAGTGSESTRYAVIYYEGKKQSVTHPSIVPDYALLEPRVLVTLPAYQKRCTVMDAYCQAIESWWSVNSTELSRQLSRQALETLQQNIDHYVFGTQDAGRDAEVAAEVMRAANLAGQAINITQTTAPHAMSYKLTSLYHIPHGHAVAVSLPEVWEYMLQHLDLCVDPRGSAYLETVFTDIARTLRRDDPKQCIDDFRNRMRQYDMLPPVPRNRVETWRVASVQDMRHDVSLLAKSVNPVRLKNNPVALSEPALRMMYEKIVRVMKN